MNDKIQLAAMGAEMAEQQQQPMCMAKRIEELEAQVRVMAGLLRDAKPYMDHRGGAGPKGYAQLSREIDAALAGKLPERRIEELEAHGLELAELLRDLHGYIGASIPQTISEHYRGCDLLDRIDAAMAGSLPSTFAPEGWQLVPVEPTESMIGHGCGASVMVVSEVVMAWAAMLAAAPKLEAK